MVVPPGRQGARQAQTTMKDREMSQNLLQLQLNAEDYAAIDGALSTLEQRLAGLIDLSVDERRGLVRMGEKSEAFCRQTLMAMEERPKNFKAVSKLAYGYLNHLWLWDKEATINELKKVGFKTIREIEFNDSEDPMFNLVENKKRFDLCVKLEAVK